MSEISFFSGKDPEQILKEQRKKKRINWAIGIGAGLLFVLAFLGLGACVYKIKTSPKKAIENKQNKVKQSSEKGVYVSPRAYVDTDSDSHILDDVYSVSSTHDDINIDTNRVATMKNAESVKSAETMKHVDTVESMKAMEATNAMAAMKDMEAMKDIEIMKAVEEAVANNNVSLPLADTTLNPDNIHELITEAQKLAREKTHGSNSQYLKAFGSMSEDDAIGIVQSLLQNKNPRVNVES